MPISRDSSQNTYQGDAELMMQETLAEATNIPHWVLHGQIVTRRPGQRIHGSTNAGIFHTSASEALCLIWQCRLFILLN